MKRSLGQSSLSTADHQIAPMVVRKISFKTTRSHSPSDLVLDHHNFTDCTHLHPVVSGRRSPATTCKATWCWKAPPPSTSHRPATTSSSSSTGTPTPRQLGCSCRRRRGLSTAGPPECCDQRSTSHMFKMCNLNCVDIMCSYAYPTTFMAYLQTYTMYIRAYRYNVRYRCG